MYVCFVLFFSQSWEKQSINQQQKIDNTTIIILMIFVTRSREMGLKSIVLLLWYVTVHDKTRLIGHFWENVVLIKLINMKTAEKKSENRTVLSQTDVILLSFDKFEVSKK